ncbi:MAG: hypothetical protein K5987_00985 [Lachnospiraceae bacterium]|nr:hypothetical protein [Lachnospiraceae bacterium]
MTVRSEEKVPKNLSDLEKALEVTAKIDKLGSWQDIDALEKAITIARTAYDLLSDSQKDMINNKLSEKLEEAEAALEFIRSQNCKEA